MRDVIQALIDRVSVSDTKKVASLRLAQEAVDDMTLRAWLFVVDGFIKHSKLDAMVWVRIKGFALEIQAAGTWLAEMKRCCDSLVCVQSRAAFADCTQGSVDEHSCFCVGCACAVLLQRQLARRAPGNRPSIMTARLLVQLVQVLPRLPPAPSDDLSLRRGFHCCFLRPLLPILRQVVLVVPSVQ